MCTVNDVLGPSNLEEELQKRDPSPRTDDRCRMYTTEIQNHYLQIALTEYYRSVILMYG